MQDNVPETIDKKTLENIRRDVELNTGMPGRRTIRRLLNHIQALNAEIESMIEDAAGEDI